MPSQHSHHMGHEDEDLLHNMETMSVTHEKEKSTQKPPDSPTYAPTSPPQSPTYAGYSSSVPSDTTSPVFGESDTTVTKKPSSYEIFKQRLVSKQIEDEMMHSMNKVQISKVPRGQPKRIHKPKKTYNDLLKQVKEGDRETRWNIPDTLPSIDRRTFNSYEITSMQVYRMWAADAYKKAKLISHKYPQSLQEPIKILDKIDEIFSEIYTMRRHWLAIKYHDDTDGGNLDDQDIDELEDSNTTLPITYDEQDPGNLEEAEKKTQQTRYQRLCNEFYLELVPARQWKLEKIHEDIQFYSDKHHCNNDCYETPWTTVNGNHYRKIGDVTTWLKAAEYSTMKITEHWVTWTLYDLKKKTERKLSDKEKTTIPLMERLLELLYTGNESREQTDKYFIHLQGKRRQWELEY